MVVINDLDQKLFNGYIQTKLGVAVALLRKGILSPDMDWYDTPQPTGEGLNHHILCRFI